MKVDRFKICPTCSKHWKTLADFLADPELELAGYQVNFADLKDGLFYFSHLREDCGTTLAIPVKQFIGLSTRPILASRATPSGDCSGLCVRQNELDPCPEECECVWVREVMQTILHWKKKAA